MPVILSGGSGTRLWPLSRSAHPKQFHALVGERTLFAQTIERARAVPGAIEPMIICNETHRHLAAAQQGTAGGTIVLEPTGRNTAPAVAAAALLVLETAGPDENPLLLVLPADHVVEDSAAFASAVESGIEAADQGYLVTFGVVPSRAETGYGYLRCGIRHGNWFELERFVEKPDPATAAKYVDSGEYLWNSGMFLLSARTLLGELGQHAPAILSMARAAVEQRETEDGCIRLGAAFCDCPAESIDYAVMEKTGNAAAVPLEAAWSDVGSWLALHEALPSGVDGNSLRGNVLVEGVSNSLVSGGKRLIGVVGLDNVVVIDTDDAVLVMSKTEARRLQRLVERVDPKNS